MYIEQLQDLLSSGVKWELSEKSTTCLDAPTTVQAQNTAQKMSGAVVPPIAPTQTVSQATAVSMASRPSDMDSLCRMISEFNHPLRNCATNVVLPWIAPNPNGMVILTDMPGADDDASGKILSGATGELMDKMLSAIEMSRDNVSIVPMLFWRTPGGRTPTREEIDLARPFVDRALEFLLPRVILTLGSLPAAEVGLVQIARDHGKIVDLPNGVKLIAMYHPNYIMLKPSAKRDAWAALQDAQKLLKTV
ncbi:MAG: uracil-DNA glycosylase [Alphaproteobacteria bacterium]|nr:uracil-DNA glycosylase [Alphaproteobacteria bacterium]